MSRNFTWPWGRISPEKRMEELERMIGRHKASIRILKSQIEESIRLHIKSIEALEDQKRIVASFLDEVKRKALMEEAFDLEARGFSVLDKISNSETLEEIDKIMKEAREEMEKKSLDVLEKSPKYDEDNGLDIFEEVETSINDIFGKEDQ